MTKTYLDIANVVEDSSACKEEVSKSADKPFKKKNDGKNRHHTDISKVDEKDGDKMEGGSQKSAKSKKRKSQLSHSCRNKDCKKLQLMNGCGNTSKEEKTRLLKEYYDARKKRKSIPCSTVERR